MDITNSYGVATEFHDEMAVAHDAHDVALLTFEHAGEYAQLDMILGELDEGVAKKGDTMRFLFHDFHERAHETVGYRGGFTGGTVVDQIILWEMADKKSPQLMGFTLEEDEATDGGFLFFDDTLAVGLLFIVGGSMDETLGFEFAFHLSGSKCFFKTASGHVLDEDVAPGCLTNFRGAIGFRFQRMGRGFYGLGGGIPGGRRCLKIFPFGYFSHFRDRYGISPDYVDALW